MKPEQAPDKSLSKDVKGSMLEKEKDIEEYILGTLLYTPQSYVKNHDFVEILVYRAGEGRPAMKISRAISRLAPLDNDPENLKEIAFQDEINVLKGEKMDPDERWKLNFSVFVDKENFQYKSIREKPKDISHITESVDIFRNLVKQKGAVLNAGEWRFESDGNSWVPSPRGGKSIAPKMKSLMPGLPALEE